MDFESCFTDYYKKRQELKPEQTDQSDSKCTGDTTNQNLWINPGKKSKGIREMKTEIKATRQKKLMDIHCNCCTRNSKGKPETPEENKSPIIFEDYDGSWTDFLARDSKYKEEKFCLPEESSKEDRSEKLLLENFMKLEEKVDFLLRQFKDFGHEDTTEQGQTKTGGDAVSGVWLLFNLRKRLTAAEEGIEKLAMMVQELLKDAARRKERFDVDGSNLDFEGMTVGQRINFLKNRNDLLTAFLKAMLKVGSAEEIFPKSVLSPSNEEIRSPSAKHKFYFDEKDLSKDLKREEITDVLMKLRGHVSEIQQTNNQDYMDYQKTNRDEIEESVYKFSGNKLEVIPEQAEFGLKQNSTESIVEEVKRKNGVRNLKGKFSQVSEEREDFELRLCDTTSKLLAQEALLKSSLDKVHSELFSKLDSVEKNFLKNGQNNFQGQSITEQDENGHDSGPNSDSLSDISDIFRQDADIITITSSVKHQKQEECKEPKKEENLLSLDINGSKGSRICSKVTENNCDSKPNKFSRKVLHQGCFVVGTAPKAKVPESYSSKYGRSKLAASNGDRRPLTAPSTDRKSLYSSAVVKSSSRSCERPLVQGDGPKKISGIHNFRIKNKLLLNKKPFGRNS